MRRSIAILLSIAATLFLVFSSPFYLQWLAKFKKADWTEIGNIGQAYGAASAVLSALALLGVAVSVILQVREHLANRSQIVRSQHFRLLELAIEKPELYTQILGLDGRAMSANEIRQHLFTTMFVNYAETGYSLGNIPELSLREEVLRGIFASEPGRKWWLRTERDWQKSGRSSKFVQIVEDEYSKATFRKCPPIPSHIVENEATNSLCDRGDSKFGVAKTGAAIMAGLLIGVAVNRARRN
jgi:hypothetical protein